MEDTHRSSQADSHEERNDNVDAEIITERKQPLHQEIAREMKEIGIECSALPYGSSELEHQETYYSHIFAFSSRLVTNKGVVKLSGKNIDFVQILQRN